MAKRKRYQESTDIKRIISSWSKLSKLQSRKSWSLVIIQATATVEIAEDLVIRKELQSRCRLDAVFVNHLLEWANGIVGKMDSLILPLFSRSKQLTRLKMKKRLIEKINEKRNAIIQRCKLCTEREAATVINRAKIVIESFVKIYRPEFNLDDGR